VTKLDLFVDLLLLMTIDVLDAGFVCFRHVCRMCVSEVSIADDVWPRPGSRYL
jgi:hypothetical protein